MIRGKSEEPMMGAADREITLGQCMKGNFFFQAEDGIRDISV